MTTLVEEKDNSGDQKLTNIQDVSPVYLSERAEEICRKRYYQKDENGNPIEDWPTLAKRVVNHVCLNEDETFKEEIYQLILNTEALPNSPCLVNAGSKNKSRGLQACYITKATEDSWLSMTETIANFGHIARQGGGAGISLSKIRPEGDSVFGSTHAKACGPIEHMRMISEVMVSITQSGFRSMAILCSLSIDHPDIEKFIKCKQHERALKNFLKEDFFGHYDKMIENVDGQLRVILDKFLHNVNISVLVTDEFMEKVEKDEDFDLTFNGKVYKTVKAKKLFDLIAQNAWQNGDPGLLFYDAINDSPYKYSHQELTAANPCISGETLVAVADGRIAVSIKTLTEEGKDIPVFCSNDSGKITVRTMRNPRITGLNKKILKITLDNEQSFRVTEDHKFILSNRKEKETKNLHENDSLFSMSKMVDSLDAVIKENRIVSVTEDGYETVYNGTVDEYHNFFIGYFEEKINGFQNFVYINCKNCGEIPGGDYFSCNLMSIDVSKFYVKSDNDIDWKKLKKTIHNCIRFLDDMIDANVFPTPDFEKWAKENRPVGLGIMGFADLLLKMKLVYGKSGSLEFAEKLASFLKQEAHKASVELGKERGTPKACQYKELNHRRNVVTLSIAPTGTIAQLAGCSHSIEPIYSSITIRKDNTGTEMVQHPMADKSWFRCAVDPEDKMREVTWKEHIKMQAIFQKYIDNSLSKTCNFSSSATVDNVKEAYMFAWKSKVKGITIYRDGSKSAQVLTSKDKHTIQSTQAKNRPKRLEADIFRTTAQGFDWHIIVGRLDDNPYEIFAVNGSQALPESGVVIREKNRHYSLYDSSENLLIDNLVKQERNIDVNIDKETRRFSLELRHGIHPKHIVEQIDKSNDVVTSFCKAVSRIFRTKYISMDDAISVAEDIACPDCAARGRVTQLIPSGSCWECPLQDCGYSRCG